MGDKDKRENFECSMVRNQAFAFTIKKLGNADVTEVEYEMILRHFSENGYVECSYYERDSKDKLHIHGIIQLRKGFFRKKLCLFGFHVKLDELYNRQGWERYILKDQEETLKSPKINNNIYMF